MVDRLEKLRKALADRYKIIKTAGSGGMSTVYLAEDLKHHRKVALKVLRPELEPAIGADRFLREIEIAAQLQHPHILPLYDSGEVDGLLYYTMPFVDGESLADRMRREKQLSLDDAIQFTCEVADGLHYAHGLGIVHRDIKPDNIMLTGGHAVVADFGIARALSEAGVERLTATGIAIGTPAYMSPEQAGGDVDVDQRTDIYSLGTVLFEMLAGDPPYMGTSARVIIARRLSEPTPHVSVVRDTVPPWIEAALEKALAKTPADRFSTAADFAKALTVMPEATGTGAWGAPTRRPALKKLVQYGAAAVAVAALALFGLSQFASRPLSAEGPTRLLVKPFAELSATGDEDIAAGLTEEIRIRLGRVTGLRPIARQSAMQYRTTDKSPQEIGAELNVRYILDGTVRTQRATPGTGQVRISAELIQVSDASTVWSETFTGSVNDVFQMQTDVAEQVTEALGIALLEPARQALAAQPTDDPDAYDFYLRGNGYLIASMLPGDARLAVQMYQNAVDEDSNFAEAHARLSRAHSWMYYSFFDRSDERLTMAKQAADRALALDPQLPDAHLALGYYHYWGSLDYDLALEEFDIALQNDRNNSELLLAIGVVKRRKGDWTDAATTLTEAATLDPRNVVLLVNLAETYRYLRNYAEAEQYFTQAITLAPGGALGQILHAAVHLNENDGVAKFQEAIRTAATRSDAPTIAAGFLVLPDLVSLLRFADTALGDALIGLSLEASRADSAHYYLGKAEVYVQRGRQTTGIAYFDSARVVLEDRLRVRPNESQFHSQLGLAYAGLGRAADAVREGERAVSLLSVSEDAMTGTKWLYNLAQIYTMVGNNDAALESIETLLAIPSPLSRGMLTVDPVWTPLRSLPRFRNLTR